MKKQAFTNFATLILLSMLTAVSVSAQSHRSGAINIPFNFTIGQQTMPPGQYTVGPNRKDFNNVWLVQSRDSRTNALFTTMSVRANETQEKTRLVFHKYGDQYFLSQIWTPGGQGGRQLPVSQRERELARNASVPQLIVLNAVRN